MAEPSRTTPQHLLSILEALQAREPIFHRPEHGTTRADFERMTAEEFWETGASGKRYGRDVVLDELERRYSAAEYHDEWETSDFYCQQLADDLYLLTYTLAQGRRITRRATIWRMTNNGWKIVYHQGTIVEE